VIFFLSISEQRRREVDRGGRPVVATIAGGPGPTGGRGLRGKGEGHEGDRFPILPWAGMARGGGSVGGSGRRGNGGGGAVRCSGERGEMWLGDGRRGEWCRPQFIGVQKRWKGRAEHGDHVRPAGAMAVPWLDSAGVKAPVAGSGSGAVGKDPLGSEATRGGTGRESSTRSSCSSCNGGSAVWPWWVGRDSRRTKSVAATKLLDRTRRAARRQGGSGRRVMVAASGPSLVVFCWRGAAGGLRWRRWRRR
jgi:hypothetical protein